MAIRARDPQNALQIEEEKLQAVNEETFDDRIIKNYIESLRNQCRGFFNSILMEDGDESICLCDLPLKWWMEEFDALMKLAYDNLEAKNKDGVKELLFDLQSAISSMLELTMLFESRSANHEYFRHVTDGNNPLLKFTEKSQRDLSDSFKLNKGVILYIVVEGVNLPSDGVKLSNEAPLYALKFDDIDLENFYLPDDDNKILYNRKSYELILGPLGVRILDLLYTYYDTLQYAAFLRFPRISGFSTYKAKEKTPQYFQLMRIQTSAEIASAIAKMAANSLNICNSHLFITKDSPKMEYQIFQLNTFAEVHDPYKPSYLQYEHSFSEPKLVSTQGWMRLWYGKGDINFDYPDGQPSLIDSTKTIDVHQRNQLCCEQVPTKLYYMVINEKTKQDFQNYKYQMPQSIRLYREDIIFYPKHAFYLVPCTVGHKLQNLPVDATTADKMTNQDQFQTSMFRYQVPTLVRKRTQFYGILDQWWH